MDRVGNVYRRVPREWHKTHTNLIGLLKLL